MSEFWLGALGAGSSVLCIAAIIYGFMFITLGTMDMPSRAWAFFIRAGFVTFVIGVIATAAVVFT